MSLTLDRITPTLSHSSLWQGVWSSFWWRLSLFVELGSWEKFCWEVVSRFKTGVEGCVLLVECKVGCKSCCDSGIGLGGIGGASGASGAGICGWMKSHKVHSFVKVCF